MGSCCSTSSGSDSFEEKILEGDKDIPDIPPAVYIDLTIPHVPGVPPEMSVGAEQVRGTNWENVVNFDNIITKFTQSSGVLTQLAVKQHDAIYFKRLCEDTQKPKPVIIATVTNPEDSGWECHFKETLWKVIDEEFGKGSYRISIACPRPKKKTK